MPSRGDGLRALFAALLVVSPAGASAEEPGGKAPRPAEGAGDEEDLQARIQAAVDRGREALHRRFPRIVEQPPAPYPMGHIALPLAALLRAGTSSEHPLVVQAFEKLAAEPLLETYSVATYLMALDALVQAKHREARAARGLTRAARATPEGPLRARMEEAVRWLVSARNLGQGTWDYRSKASGQKRGQNQSHDNSNTQFAVLGLAIGLEYGIPIPREVWEEIGRHFSQSLILERELHEFTVTFNPGKKALLTRVRNRKAFRALRGGWAYQKNDQAAYASMTAAGASSLLVARAGLGGLLDRSGQSALEAAFSWITSNFDRFIPQHARWYYYTLYSLEKVGDLGDILLFNDRDWYAEGSEEILERQEPDGSWGISVDTSFALLFLTRASRPSVRALAPPRVITQAGGVSAEGGDRVYISTIDGYISAAEFFEYLESTRDRDLLKVAEEVVRNYPLLRQGEMVPHLLALWSDRADPISSFARRALKEVTGEGSLDREGYRGWHEAFLAIRAAEEGRDLDPDRLAGLFSRAPGFRLKGRLVELIGREGLAECVPALIDQLEAPDGDYRLRVADILERLTGKRPLGRGEAGLAEAREAAHEWRTFWRSEGVRMVAAARIRKLITTLEVSPRGEEAPGGGEKKGGEPPALAALVAEGRTAVPHILEAMGKPEFPARLLIALEGISGKRLGLRPPAWRAWWEAESGGK